MEPANSYTCLDIFDFDETLKNTFEPMRPVLFSRLHGIVQKHWNGHLSRDDFDALNRDMHRRHGSSIAGWQVKLGKDVKWMLDTFEDLSDDLADAVNAAINVDPMLILKFQRAQQLGHTQAIFTHSHIRYILKVLARVGLLPYVEGRVFDISFTEGVFKTEHASHQKVLNALEYQKYAEWHFFEDSILNLGPARDLGGHTWLINPGFPPQEYAHFVRSHHFNIHSALDHHHEGRLAA